MNKKIIAFCMAVLLLSINFINLSTKVYAKEVVATYTTVFELWDEPRANNIKLSTDKINNLIVKRGEIFSFNRVVGERTTERGYKESIVLVYDEKVKGVGGGVCQVSSTIYNCALIANMEIIERHEHLGEVHYVPDGKDATVSYPELDFQFKNNLEYDVYINAYTSENNLTIEIIKL